MKTYLKSKHSIKNLEKHHYIKMSFKWSYKLKWIQQKTLEKEQKEKGKRRWRWTCDFFHSKRLNFWHRSFLQYEMQLYIRCIIYIFIFCFGFLLTPFNNEHTSIIKSRKTFKNNGHYNDVTIYCKAQMEYKLLQRICSNIHIPCGT